MAEIDEAKQRFQQVVDDVCRDCQVLYVSKMAKLLEEGEKYFKLKASEIVAPAPSRGIR